MATVLSAKRSIQSLVITLLLAKCLSVNIYY
jgi:hypothetical protein